ncbi:hypothetical protein ABT390_16560 [Streptomyces aurantiacus]|nr:hypothetical protein [Streptomyces aurantiacus]
MRATAVLVSLVAAASVLGLTGAAQAASSGQVVVFSHEFTPLVVHQDPEGCKTLPAGAHELSNLTDKPVRIYSNPFCQGDAMVVQPGYGTHVYPAAGSFSV